MKMTIILGISECLNKLIINFCSQKQLKMLLLDLFFAGSETTVTTTKWGKFHHLFHSILNFI